MNPVTSKHKLTQTALRTARSIGDGAHSVEDIAEIVDRETGLRDLVDVL